MYIKVCKWCNETIEVNVQQNFASHIATCSKNPKLNERKIKFSLLRKGVPRSEHIIVDRICPNCLITFQLTGTSAFLNSNKSRRYCSRKCANARSWSDEKKLAHSSVMKNSEKAKTARSSKRYDLIIERKFAKSGKKRKQIAYKPCIICNQPLKIRQNGYVNKYHKACWAKVSGGFREGSSRGKSGRYKGFYCDSSWELAFIIYNLDHNIPIKRNTKGFEYEYEGKKRNFHPDFIIHDTYIEIKNYKSDLTDAKIKAFPHPIEVFYKDDLKHVFEYVHGKYGKDFIRLYENKTLSSSSG